MAIIGSGNVGGTLAQKWAKADHDILIGAQFPLSEKNRRLAAIIGEDRFTSVPEAIAQSEVVLVATPPTAVLEIISQMGHVAGKTLIDATNAVRQKPDLYATAYHAMTDKTQGQVVKCFNSTGFENMLDPLYGGVGIDMFMAEAKAIARQLALDAGFGACWDFGGGDKVTLLEQFALSWINLAIMQGHGRDIAFRIVRR